MLILYEMLHTCIRKADATLRILSTDASGCFFTNVTFTAGAEIGIKGECLSKAIINSLSSSCFSFTNQQALYFLGLSELTHVCEVPCQHAWLGSWALTADQASSLKINCQPWDCTEEHHISLPGMEHMSVELRKKYIVIHIYGIRLNTAKLADQYYSSSSYQNSSLINYLMSSDLHHDCKPYEQTKEFFTVSL